MVGSVIDTKLVQYVNELNSSAFQIPRVDGATMMIDIWQGVYSNLQTIRVVLREGGFTWKEGQTPALAS